MPKSAVNAGTVMFDALRARSKEIMFRHLQAATIEFPPVCVKQLWVNLDSQIVRQGEGAFIKAPVEIPR